MGRHFAAALQLHSYRSEQQKQKIRYSRKFHGHANIIGACIAVLCLAALLNYLFQVNSFATKGYEIKKLDTRLTQLKEQHRKLQLEAAQLQSIQKIQMDQATLNMVPVSSISYIQITSLSQK